MRLICASSPTRSPERNISEQMMALRSPTDVRRSVAASRRSYSSTVATCSRVNFGARGIGMPVIGERRPSRGSV